MNPIDFLRRVNAARRRSLWYREDVGLPLTSFEAYSEALSTAAAPRRRVLFYPELPSRWSIASKICTALRYEVSNDPARPADVAVWYENTTYPTSDRSVLPPGLGVVNAGCCDISKRRVGIAFEAAFGYPLTIDPTTYDGPMVEKSDENYAHDGVVLAGPIAAPRPDRVYQVCVDAREGDDVFIDYRTHVSGGHIPVVFRKPRPSGERRFADVLDCEMRDPADVFDAEERRRILALCDHMGVEFAELDILRDRETGRIYVVDVNVTPAGPRHEMSSADRIGAVRRMADAFDALVTSKL
ncbi:MAG: hypothetical protein AAF845_12145 [Bacteroidota bacterium]